MCVALKVNERLMVAPTSAPASTITIDPVLDQVSDGSGSETREAVGHGLFDKVGEVVGVSWL